MGTTAITRRRDVKRRFSSGESLVTTGIVVEVKLVPGIKRGGACSGHRLDRIPSGDTRLVSAPLYGRCLLVEANLCANCDGPGLTNTSNLRRTGDIVKRFGFRSHRLPHLYETAVTGDSRRETPRRTARTAAALSRLAPRRA